jgi:hypothetical protein
VDGKNAFRRGNRSGGAVVLEELLARGGGLKANFDSAVAARFEPDSLELGDLQ